MLERKVVSQCISSNYCRGWNDAVEAMPCWISVEERLPEHMDDVLTWVGGLVEVGCYDESNECWELYTYVGDGSVTHWMPLPSTEGLHDN